jgi:DNA-binding transcriptional regulator of glucitol operon
MRRILIVLAAGCASLALAVPVALAQNEHFIRASGSLSNNGSLTVSFKEAGLGTNQLINYTLTADATATYVASTVAVPTPAPRTRRLSPAR